MPILKVLMNSNTKHVGDKKTVIMFFVMIFYHPGTHFVIIMTS